MITSDQIKKIAKSKNTNETTVFREYLQLLFLSRLYAFTESSKVFFKGGTALHFVFGAPRFSEDLDFTVNLKKPSLKSSSKRFSKNSPVRSKLVSKRKKVLLEKHII